MIVILINAFLSCQKYHEIALPNTQSLFARHLNGTNGIYSKSYEKMIIFGCCKKEFATNVDDTFSGIYCKSKNKHGYGYNINYCGLIVYGFLRQFELQLQSLEKLLIPNELRGIIVKYYFVPDDKHWQQLISTNKDGYFDANIFGDYFYKDCGFILVNNDIDMYIFGGNDEMITYTFGSNKDVVSIYKFNLITNELRLLTDIQCPKLESYVQVPCTWHAVFCKKSQSVHLFQRRFKAHVCISLQKLINSSSVFVHKHK